MLLQLLLLLLALPWRGRMICKLAAAGV